MAKPSRAWAVITALVAQLATITVANGYNTDVGGNVWTEQNQRKDGVLGLTLYSGDITSASGDKERPGKPTREFVIMLEAQTDATLDDAHQNIHALIEDLEACMEAFASQQIKQPLPGTKPLRLESIAVDDRPEGLPVIGIQARIIARYFR